MELSDKGLALLAALAINPALMLAMWRPSAYERRGNGLGALNSRKSVLGQLWIGLNW